MKTNSYEWLDEIDIYFKDISKYRPLSRKREEELGKRIQKGDEKAVEELVNANLRFVVSVAKNYRSSGVPFHDLISEGNIGLLRAAKRFDGAKGIKFISYAIWWVRSAMRECIAQHTKGNEYYSDDYNTMMCRESEFEFNPNVINEEYETEIVNLTSRGDALQDLMDVLNERESKIIMMYFGFGRNEGYTLEEIGDTLHITKERVRQIKDDALSKLKVNALLSEEFDTYKEIR